MNDKAPALSLDTTRFVRDWSAIGGAACDALDVLRQGYAQRYRAYHNAEHIVECLGWLDTCGDLAERPHEVAIAIFFHDAVYRPGAADNERRSAHLFKGYAAKAGVSKAVTRRVADLIESTAIHDGQSVDATLLNDIDQAILGASPARYRRYVHEIRHEYAGFSDLQFSVGRTAFLKAQLSKLSIYATPRFQAGHESQARTNLAAELERLQRGAPRCAR